MEIMRLSSIKQMKRNCHVQKYSKLMKNIKITSVFVVATILAPFSLLCLQKKKAGRYK